MRPDRFRVLFIAALSFIVVWQTTTVTVLACGAGGAAGVASPERAGKLSQAEIASIKNQIAIASQQSANFAKQDAILAYTALVVSAIRDKAFVAGVAALAPALAPVAEIATYTTTVVEMVEAHEALTSAIAAQQAANANMQDAEAAARGVSK